MIFLPKSRALYVVLEKGHNAWEKGHGAREKGHGVAPYYNRLGERLDNRIPLLPYSEISSLWPSSVVVQHCLRRTWPEILMTGFLMTRLF